MHDARKFAWTRPFRDAVRVGLDCSRGMKCTVQVLTAHRVLKPSSDILASPGTCLLNREKQKQHILTPVSAKATPAQRHAHHCSICGAARHTQRCACTHAHMCTHTCTHACARAHTYNKHKRTRTNTQTRVSTHKYAQTHRHTRAHTHIHTNIHARTHTHTHTCICTHTLHALWATPIFSIASSHTCLCMCANQTGLAWPKPHCQGHTAWLAVS